MSILSKLFGGGDNPADAANQYLNQIPGVGHQYYDPYVTGGREAGDKLKGQYGNLIDDPNAFIDKLMEGYEPSKGFQFKKDQLTKQMGNTAASGGFAGTSYDQMQQGQGVDNLLSQDMQDYLSNVFGAYKTGLAGEGDIFNKGFDASGKLADLLGGALNQQGGLAFQGTQQKNQNQAQLFQSLIKALGMAGGMGMTGGLSGLGSLATGGFGSDMFGGG